MYKRQEYYKSLKKFRKRNSNIIIATYKMFMSNRHQNGGYLVHIGIVLLFIGFIGRAFESEKYGGLRAEFRIAAKRQLT